MSDQIILTREEIRGARSESLRFRFEPSRCFWRWDLDMCHTPGCEPRCSLYDLCKRLTEFAKEKP